MIWTSIVKTLAKKTTEEVATNKVKENNIKKKKKRPEDKCGKEHTNRLQSYSNRSFYKG